MFYFEFLICILTPLILLHELGHYLMARRYSVPVRRVSLFFNIGFTLLKYNPATGRVALLSRRTQVEVELDNGTSMHAMGERSWISFQLTRGYVHDSLIDPTGQLVPARGTLYKSTVVKISPPTYLPKWRQTEYCLGFLPFGGYASVDRIELARRTTTQQLLFNAGGLMVNALITVVCLAISIIMSRVGCDAKSCSIPLQYALFSFLLFGLNVLPLAGLDGGNILRNCASYFVDVESSIGFRRLYLALSLITLLLLFGGFGFVSWVYYYSSQLLINIYLALV